MNTAHQPMYEWNTLPWRTIERTVFKLAIRASIKLHRLATLTLSTTSSDC